MTTNRSPELEERIAQVFAGQVMPLDEALTKLELVIRQGEADSIVARWEFGKALLPYRSGMKRLPNGFLRDLLATLKIGKSEVSARMLFAETFPDRSQLSALVDLYGNWTKIKSILPKEPKEDDPIASVRSAWRKLNKELA